MIQMSMKINLNGLLCRSLGKLLNLNTGLENVKNGPLDF